MTAPTPPEPALIADYVAPSRCLNCRQKIRWGRFCDIGGWEPDYDPADDPERWRHLNGYASCGNGWATPRPEIVVLCGSTRFMDAFQDANLHLTLQGIIVLSIGCNTKSDAELEPTLPKFDKVALDELHKRKIDLADRVLVLNVDGYIGESTRSEIDYAIAHDKPIEYLENALIDGQETQ